MILWHERLTAGPDGAACARALLELADALSLADTAGAGLLEIPAQSNGRGLREAGVLPERRPRPERARPRATAPMRRDARGIAEGLAEGELAASAARLRPLSPEAERGRPGPMLTRP